MRGPAKRRLLRGAVAFVGLAVAILAADALLPPPLDRVAERSAMVVDSAGEPLRVFTTRDGKWRFSAAAGDVDPLYLRMLKEWEDRRFDSHPGIDPLAIVRALAQAAEAGRIVSGASTLSMQTARLMEPRPRSPGAKLVEMARAVQLEARLGKEGVLSLYLDLAPFGGNIEGVRAASLFYFGKEPDRLDAAEAALLVALPQSPERRRPERDPANARRERDRVLRLMAERGVIDAATAREAMEAPVPEARLPAAFLAPHLAERARAAAPAMERVETHVDGTLQGALERLVAAHARDLEGRATIALIAVANDGRRVIGYVGSSNFLDQERGGPIDMVRAIRSPGSALKPLIYGLGFDDLALAPATIIDDRPTRFGGWAPRNFDRFHRGEVSAAEALQLSLNVPAVAVLQKVGPRRFAALLASAGAPLVLPGDEPPGLPVALGGVGTSLERLVTLYAGLADGGLVRPLSLRPGDVGEGEGTRLLSPVSAWYVSRILAETPPPPDLVPGQHLGGGRVVSFKTGTSYGFRDAWAIGYDRDYTLGVWVGRPDGGYSPGRLGREAAAPLLFEAFSLLPKPAGGTILPPPPEGARMASNAELPPALRRLAAGGDSDGASLGDTGSGSRTDGPRIAFPPAGAVLEVSRGADGAPLSLGLEAEGGNLPLIWLVDGLPVARSTYRRQADWRPTGTGAARVTVIDRDGRSASAEVWLQ